MAEILIVDDERDFREVVRITLERAGHTVAEAHSGPAALAFLQGSVPDLVVTDVSMAGGNGIALAGSIRLDPRLHRVPVVVLTGSTDPAIAWAARQMGATVVSKPIKTRALLAVVERALEGSAAASA